jgi:hypothetical protein
MPISSRCGTVMTCIEDASADRYQGKPAGTGTMERSGMDRSARSGARMPVSNKCALYYPWLIERISQTFFQEWIGAWCVPTKIDHAEWLCIVCGEYTATWETRSGSYCKYCWTLEQRSPLGPAPQYMLEMIPHDEI